MSKQKVIITGGSGLLGINFAFRMKEKWDIYLFYRSKSIDIEGISCINIDLSDEDKLNTICSQISPDIIIHTAGLTNVELCETDYFKAYESNVLTTRYVAQAASRIGAKFVHISTDHFSNSLIPYSNESEIEIPVNNYAKTKMDGEFEAIRASNNCLIVRTNFYGWGHHFRTSFSDLIINTLRKKEEITLFDDVFYTPIYVDELIDNIDKLVNLNASGIFNIVGEERLTKYMFGLKLASIFELDQNLIKKGSLSQKKDLVKRPMDMSLSSTKLKETLNSKTICLETSLSHMKQAEFDGVRSKIEKSVSIKDKSQIQYGKQFIDEDDINSVIKTLNGNFLTQGPKVEEFEKRISTYVNAKYAVAVSNWTCGLHIACLAAGVKPGDTVLTSPLSFVASSNCAIYSGATPAFADINLETLNIDPVEVERKCKELGNVKAIIPVHFAGHPCDMKELKRIADKYGAVIIEDAAHALGGSYLEGGKIGSCNNSLMCGFSFHPVKNIATGEGSVITTNDPEVYKQLLRLRSHGIIKGNDPFLNFNLAYTNKQINPWYYEMQQIGFNYRITDIQCSLGTSQLKKLNLFLNRRIEICKMYDNAFSDLTHLKLVQNLTREISGNHLYVALIDYEKLGKSRLEFFNELKKYGINAHVHYIPIPLQPFYEKFLDIPKRDFTNAQNYYDKAITLPLYPSMSNGEVNHIIATIKKILNE